MNRHNETNPHFVRPSHRGVEPDSQDQRRPRQTTTTSTSPRRQRPRRDGHSRPPGQHQPQQQRPEKHTQPASTPTPHTPMVPLHTHHPDEQHHLEPPRGHPDDHLVERRGWVPSPLIPHQPGNEEQHPTAAPTLPLLNPRRHEGHTGPQASPVPDPTRSANNEDQQHPRSHDPHQQPHHHRHRHGSSLHMPQPRKTHTLTWFLAIFCAVLWVVVILGGLIVLVVYLVFRPRSPRFDVSDATLNAAYLDMGYLLNADMMLLGNFTNPNRKVGIEFNYMFVELYYGRTLVATQYLEPFSAPRGETRFANLHMVTSQVRLSELEVQRIKRQTLNNGIVFEVKGFFRARSNFGGFLRYSYWLHTRCTIMLTRPPGGILAARRCKTKH